jgi:hypothetical protein
MTFLSRLQTPGPLLTAELRPPRMGQSQNASIDAWFAMNATIQGLAATETPLFLTDGAVGSSEEENLHHLVTNLDESVPRDLVCPFLTTKHTLEYCLWYAARAVESGASAITVLGGDKGVGAPRCVPHGYQLRQQIRERYPSLALGGWANPHADPTRQVAFLTDPGATADFYLTQLVSHHDLPAIDAFLAERDRQGLDLPSIFGVFFYRSARKKTLLRLAKFFEVPVEGIIADFAEGLTAEAVCARTIIALRKRGIDKVYVSNLDTDLAPLQLAKIQRAIRKASA